MKILPKTLITGSNGMVGTYFDFGIKTNRNELDVTNLESVSNAVKKYKPKIIIHLAALTDLDYCEKNPNEAFMVNGVGTYNVALAAKEAGAKLIYISTAGIFDGEKKTPYVELDLGNPQNYYGHSKYLGELAVKGILKDYVIARVCWMFGGGPKRDKKFVAKIVAQFGKSEIKALDDNFGSPTFSKDLVSAIKKLIIENAKGIFHLAGKGQCSRYEFAKRIAHELKSNIKITPVSGDYFNLPAKRVRNEILKSKRNLMRPWQEALSEYLKTEWRNFI